MPSPRETLLIRNLYDPLDRLIANELPNRPNHQRFYCKSRVATEIHGAASHSIIQHDDQLLAQQQSEGGATGTTLLATDQQRSVLNTIKANHSRHPIAYTPYGDRPAASGLLSLLGFNGERPDPVTGWYLLGNGYRAFNPALMRFIGPDSLSPFKEGGLNSYAYCLGDPKNRHDSNGHVSFKTLSIVITKLQKMQKMQKRSTLALRGKTNGAFKFGESLKLKRPVANIKPSHPPPPARQPKPHFKTSAQELVRYAVNQRTHQP